MTHARSGAILFTILFAAALATTVLVVGSRSPELVLEVVRLPERITPNGDNFCDKAEISFFVRKSDPAAEVYIVGRDLRLVRTLAPSTSLEENDRVTYLWDGTTDAGGATPVGNYRLRVVLPSRDRDMVFPRRMDLDRPPPKTPEERARLRAELERTGGLACETGGR